MAYPLAIKKNTKTYVKPMKTLVDFNNSKSFISYITKELSKGNFKPAGLLFEDYTKIWHTEFSDYIAVYDANDITSIPNSVLDKLDAWNIVGNNSYGIDKICVTRYSEIDVHQDKSTLHTDNNLSAKKAEGMMSLRDNPLKNVRNFVLNTTAKDLSHYKNVWKNQTPITYGFDKFVPNKGDENAVARDKQFWKNIKQKAKGQSTVKVYGFKSKGIEQDDYINAGFNYADASIRRSGFAKWFHLACGGVGKSVIDPVMLTMLEYLWTPKLTNSPVQVSVGFWHGSKTLPANGWEFVQRRRAAGIYEKVYVVSGTNVIDGENDDSVSNSFEKIYGGKDDVKKIKQDIKNGVPILLLALYHHSGEVEKIKKGLSKSYKNFKFWIKYKDEIDWPCSNINSRFSPALDNRTESVINFGSSATELIGRNPTTDYGLNNVQIHGPCVWNFTWTMAEDADLVKKLILILPYIKESEMAVLFPEFVNSKGRIDWDMKVLGVSVDNDLPTAGMIADIVCFVRALAEHPEAKRILGFANRVKYNKLIEANIPWIANKVLGNSLNEKTVKQLYVTTLRDGQYNKLTQNDTVAIKKAKGHDRYLVNSCRALDRGYDDKSKEKHHAIIEWTHTGVRQSAQRNMRIIRTDEADDKFAYNVCPQRLNDLDGDLNWCQERASSIIDIISNNKNISDEFESIIQTPGVKGGRSRSAKKGKQRIILPANFDVDAISSLVGFVAKTSRGEVYDSIARKAHTWLLKEYMKLDNPIPSWFKGVVNKEFFKIKEFSVLYSSYKNKTVWRERFWSGKLGKYFSEETYNTQKNNLIEFKKYCENQERFLAKRIVDIRKLVDTERRRQIDPHPNFSSYFELIREQFNIAEYIMNGGWVGQQCNDIIHSKEIDDYIINNNVKIVYKVIMEQAVEAEGVWHLAHLTRNALEKYDLTLRNVNDTTIHHRFLRDRTNIDKVLTPAEIEEFNNLYKIVKIRSNLRAKLWKDGIEQEYKGYKKRNIEIIRWLRDREPYIRKVEVTNPMSEERKKKISIANKKANALKKKLTNNKP